MISDRRPGRRSGIVTFTIEGVSPACLYGRLMESGVLCAQRGGGVRFSPHFYTPLERIDQALARVTELAGDCAVA